MGGSFGTALCGAILTSTPVSTLTDSLHGRPLPGGEALSSLPSVEEVHIWPTAARDAFQHALSEGWSQPESPAAAEA